MTPLKESYLGLSLVELQGAVFQTSSTRMIVQLL